MTSQRRSPSAWPLFSVLAAAAAIAFLVWPMLFTSSGFNQDWVDHLWELSRQTITLRRDHLPSLYLHDQYVFVPLFAFYGGTLYGLGATLAVLVGGVARAYVLIYVAAFSAAYGGWYWLARQMGVDRWKAHGPALVFVCSAYYLTLVYTRGDWAEFVAVSMIPLLVAALVSVVRADRLRLGPAVALAVATVLLFGSHNITALWVSTLGLLFAVAITLALPAVRSQISRKALARAGLIVVPAGLVNAWYLFPALAYGFHTGVANGNGAGLEVSLRESQHYVAASHLWTFSHSSSSNGGIVVALPLLALVWVLAGLGLSLRGDAQGRSRRVLAAICALTVLVFVLMTQLDLLSGLPHAYKLTQFSYRLDTYVTVGIAGAMLALLSGVSGHRGRDVARPWRVWLWTLPLVVAVSAVGAVQQVQTRRTLVPDRNVAVTRDQPRPFYKLALLYWYADNSLRAVDSTLLEDVSFPDTAIHRNAASYRVAPTSVDPLMTNLAAMPDLVSLHGARIIGRDQTYYTSVLELTRSAPSPGLISVSGASSAPVVLGRVVTLVALAVWALAGVIALVRVLRRGRAPRRRRQWEAAALAALAAAPLVAILAAAALRTEASAAPVAATTLARPGRETVVSGCLRRHGVQPRGALNVLAGNYIELDVPLGARGRAQVLVFPSRRAALARAPALLQFRAVQKGRAFVLFLPPGHPVDARARSAVIGCLPS
jgi:hypothetical protein